MKKDSLDSILKCNKLHFFSFTCSKGRNISWTGFFIFLISINTLAQSNHYLFNHLTTSHGLSSNNVNSVTADHNGYLWIATAEGLNKYDGYTVTSFLKEKNQNIPSDNINAISCDSRNRLWLADNEGIGMIDSNRIIHAITIDTNKLFPSSIIIETRSSGIVVIGVHSDYSIPIKDDPLRAANWKLLEWTKPTLHDGEIRDVIRLSDDRFLFIRRNYVTILDFALQKVSFSFDIPNAWSGCPVNADEILVATQRGNIFKISLPQHSITSNYHLPPDPNSPVENSSLTRIRPISDSEVIVATNFRGIYVLNIRQETIQQYQHEPLNNYSISENRIVNIFNDHLGNIFINTGHTGLDIFNTRYYKAGYVSTFSDAKGNLFDSYINDIEVDSKNRIWLAAFDRLVCYDIANNSTRFFPYYKDLDGLGKRALEIKSVCIDNRDRIWVAIYEQGVLLFNENSGQFKEITKKDTSGRETPLRSAYVHDLQAGPDGKIWASSGTGVMTIDPATGVVDPMTENPVLKELLGKRVFKIFCDDKKRMWFATQQAGAYCYDPANDTCKNYSIKEGLPSNSCICFAEDIDGNIYLSTIMGLAMIRVDGTIQVFNKANGLLSNVCKAMMSDAEGKIWIANNNSLVRYSPRENTFTYFGAESGFPEQGFVTNSFFQSHGNFYWGLARGFISFDPSLLGVSSRPLQVNISSVGVPDTVYQFTGNVSLKLPYAENDPEFHFAAIDLNGSRKIFYQYILEGYDKQWNNGSDITMVKYGSLPPGKYQFRVKASKDGINWAEASNAVKLSIAVPFWKSAWFLGSVFIVAMVIIYLINRMAVRRRKEKENIRINYEKKLAAVEMNALRAQMNPHFIFNSLNSINTFILKNDQDNATECLNKFSQLVRLILDNSRSEWILLKNELKALELYIELESIRFEGIFNYHIDLHAGIADSQIMVPPLIIQPYVENAIRHGLIHRKTDGGKLLIQVRQENGHLLIEVEDNGIGREEAGRLKSTKKQLYQSHGMQITAERLSIINEVYKVNASVNVTDLNGAPGVTGTRVLLTIQYKTHAGDHH